MSATKLGVPSGEHGARSGERKALSLRQRATVHRRAAEVCVMLAQIEDTLRCYGQSWFEGASADLLNSSIIARDLGLTDKSEVDVVVTDKLAERVARAKARAGI